MSTHWDVNHETNPAVEEVEAPNPETRRAPSRSGEKKSGDNDGKGDKGDAEKKDEKDDKKDGDKKKGPPWYKRPGPAALAIIVILACIIGGVMWWRHSQTYEFTDDAFVDVISQRVSPRIPGLVTKVLVNDNQDVQVGAPLVELDPAEYQSRVDQASASVAQAQAQLAQAKAQHQVYEAQLAQSRANLGAAEANAAVASSERRRYEELRGNNVAAVSQQQVENSEAADIRASAQVEVAKKTVSASESQLGFVDSQIEAAEAEIKSAQAQLAQAKLNLSYTKITALVSGRVARKTVAPGNNVAAGSDLMALVPREIWITANFKETQLDRMRPGQAVKIESDAYPDLKLSGKVDSVQPGSGQAFSVLPAENATGNWVKVVQRVPVKVLLDTLPDDPGIRLAPGMSVEVTVKVQ